MSSRFVGELVASVGVVEVWDCVDAGLVDMGEVSISSGV